MQAFPILEFDPTREAIIEPGRVIKQIDIPRHCVLCFFQDVIAKVAQERQARVVTHLGSEVGLNPVYEMVVDGRRLAFAHPGVGAPFAAAVLEELIAMGCERFVACGGAGVLNREIAVGHVVAPNAAVRDEGTSYHYLPPSREVQASATALAAIEQTLARHQVSYVVGKTWTNDGFYRETAGKIQRRRAEGCLTVEMETAAFFAVAQFRCVEFGQLLYGGDDVSGAEWDSRHWDKRASVREKLFWFAAEACLML
jgi:uridine phosphorylase